MTDCAEEPPPRRLAKAMAHLLEVLDEGLAVDEVPLPERPFRAARDLLRFGLVEVSGLPTIDPNKWPDYVGEPWFRVIFTGVEDWYRDHYGAEALAPRGNPPLEGVVLVRGSPFFLHVPMHRRVIEVEGKTAWMYFESGVGDGEDPRHWLLHGPNLDRLSDEQTRALDADSMRSRRRSGRSNFTSTGAAKTRYSAVSVEASGAISKARPDASAHNAGDDETTFEGDLYAGVRPALGGFEVVVLA